MKIKEALWFKEALSSGSLFFTFLAQMNFSVLVLQLRYSSKFKNVSEPFSDLNESQTVGQPSPQNLGYRGFFISTSIVNSLFEF